MQDPARIGPIQGATDDVTRALAYADRLPAHTRPDVSLSPP